MADASICAPRSCRAGSVGSRMGARFDDRKKPGRNNIRCRFFGPSSLSNTTKIGPFAGFRFRLYRQEYRRKAVFVLLVVVS
jgi:hypothetical protein